MGFDFEINYRPKESNNAADTLSRQSIPVMECSVMVSENTVDWGKLCEEIEGDPFLQQLKEKILVKGESHLEYSMENGVLLCKWRTMIPTQSSLIPILLFEYHDSPVRGHNEELKTYLWITLDWFWLGMKSQISHYVREC